MTGMAGWESKGTWETRRCTTIRVMTKGQASRAEFTWRLGWHRFSVIAAPAVSGEPVLDPQILQQFRLHLADRQAGLHLLLEML